MFSFRMVLCLTLFLSAVANSEPQATGQGPAEPSATSVAGSSSSATTGPVASLSASEFANSLSPSIVFLPQQRPPAPSFADWLNAAFWNTEQGVAGTSAALRMGVPEFSFLEQTNSSGAWPSNVIKLAADSALAPPVPWTSSLLNGVSQKVGDDPWVQPLTLFPSLQQRLCSSHLQLLRLLRYPCWQIWLPSWSAGGLLRPSWPQGRGEPVGREPRHRWNRSEVCRRRRRNWSSLGLDVHAQGCTGS